MFTNITFYIVWIIFSLLPLMIATVAPQTAKGKIIACLCVLIATFGMTAMLYQEEENANSRWNGGICACGGTYKFSAASKSYTSKTFYYTCDTCGHTEEFSNLMK